MDRGASRDIARIRQIAAGTGGNGVHTALAKGQMSGRLQKGARVSMRYWDVAQQLYPYASGNGPESHWRRLVRQLVGTRFEPVDGDQIDPDLAAALSLRGAPATLSQ